MITYSGIMTTILMILKQNINIYDFLENKISTFMTF